MRQGPSPHAAGPSPTTADSSTTDAAVDGPTTARAGPSTVAAGAGPIVPAAAAPAARDAEGSSSMAPSQMRYHTRIRPTPPAPLHPRPARRAPPAKKPQTSGLRESTTSRSRAPPSPPYQGIAGAPDLSPGSIIR